MQFSPEGKIGIFLGLVGLAGGGAIMIAPEKLWIGWTLVGLACAGGVGLGFHHFGRKFAAIFLGLGVLGIDYWYYSNVLNGAQTPIETKPTPSVSPTPSNPK